jgi:DNA-binding winged helix-turn-helix (wHTH) protein
MFGEFELDVALCELRRHSRRVKLERIPMDLLMLLVENRGRLVTREEIVTRLWGRDTFVDTENNVNAAVRKIRQALRDSPDQPVFLRTYHRTRLLLYRYSQRRTGVRPND